MDFEKLRCDDIFQTFKIIKKQKQKPEGPVYACNFRGSSKYVKTSQYNQIA